MKTIKNLVAKTSTALIFWLYVAPALAETKAEKGAKNLDALFGSVGSAILTLLLATGLGLIGYSAFRWYQNGQDNQGNTNKGENIKILKGAVAGIILSFPTAWMLFIGEAAGVVEATESAVNYRNLVSEAAR